MKNYYKVSRFLIKYFSKLTIRHKNSIFPICLKVHCHNFLQIKIIIKHHLERMFYNYGKMEIFSLILVLFVQSPHDIVFLADWRGNYHIILAHSQTRRHFLKLIDLPPRILLRKTSSKQTLLLFN